MRGGVLSSFLLGLTASACGNVLAKDNPCGGTYAVDSYASIGSVPTHGVAELRTTTDTSLPFDSDPRVLPGASCDVLVTGTASDTTSTIDYEISCDPATIALTLPDLRALGQGGRAEVPAKVTTANGFLTCLSGTATLTVVAAAGAKAPAPACVTADFSRVVTVDLELTADAGGAADASATAQACPSYAKLHAELQLRASNFTQGTATSPNTCPALPSQK